MKIQEARQRLLQRYLISLSKKSLAIRGARTAGRYGEVREIAHQLSGSGGSYGFPRLTEIAKSVEGSEDSEILEKSEQLLEHLEEIARNHATARDLTHLDKQNSA